MKNRWVRCDAFFEVADEFFEVVVGVVKMKNRCDAFFDQFFFFSFFDVDEDQKMKERSGDGEEMGFDLGLDFLVVDDDGRRKFDPGC